MGMIGLETEQVSPPHEPETMFVLRTALSPYECEWVRERTDLEAVGNLASAVGPDAIQSVFRAIDAGRAAADIVDDLNEVETPVLAISPAVDDGEDDDVAKVTAANETAARKAKTAAKKREADAVEQAARALYNLDIAAVKLVKSWSYRKVPVNLKYVRLLDTKTRAWLHDKTWAAMRIHLPEDVLAGNS